MPELLMARRSLYQLQQHPSTQLGSQPPLRLGEMFAEGRLDGASTLDGAITDDAGFRAVSKDCISYV